MAFKVMVSGFLPLNSFSVATQPASYSSLKCVDRLPHVSAVNHVQIGQNYEPGWSVEDRALD
jgi:hypothetical protein